MANEKLKVASEIKTGNGWYNFTDDKGRAIGVKEYDGKPDGKNPELKKILDFAQVGTEFEANIIEKDGKFYAWDPKAVFGGGAKKAFAPRDKSFEAAMSAMQATAVLYANKPVEELAKLPATFEKLHALIMSKAAAPAAEAPKA